MMVLLDPEEPGQVANPVPQLRLSLQPKGRVGRNITDSFRITAAVNSGCDDLLQILFFSEA